jgi:hypothetical protein
MNHKKSTVKLTALILACIMILIFSGCTKNPTDKPVEVTKQTENVCTKACQNYIDKCLTLVPNASHQLFEEGRQSCYEKCNGWSPEKITCMENAEACTAMTSECEL